MARKGSHYFLSRTFRQQSNAPAIELAREYSIRQHIMFFLISSVLNISSLLPGSGIPQSSVTGSPPPVSRIAYTISPFTYHVNRFYQKKFPLSSFTNPDSAVSHNPPVRTESPPLPAQNNASCNPAVRPMLPRQPYWSVSSPRTPAFP